MLLRVQEIFLYQINLTMNKVVTLAIIDRTLKEIDRQIDDEIRDNKYYKDLAERLRKKEYPVMTQAIEKIARDEDRHARMLMGILTFLPGGHKYLPTRK